MTINADLFFGFLSNAFKAVIIYYYLKGFLGFKENISGRFQAIWLIILFIIMNLAQAVSMIMELWFVVYVMILAITSLLCNGNWLSKILAIAGFVAISLLSDFFSSSIISFLSETGFSEVIIDDGLSTAADFITNLILLLIVRVVTIMRKTRMLKLSIKFYTTVLILPITSILLAYIVGNDMVAGGRDEPNLSLLIISLFGLMLANISLFSLFEERLAYADSEQKMEFLNQQLENQMQNYHDLDNQQQSTRKMWHDMRNYLQALNGYLDEKNYQEAKNHIGKLNESMQSLTSIADTGNSAIDALLNAKYSNSVSKDIELKWKVLIPDEIEIDSIDICLILGNALDNAIEACIKNKNPKNKYIYLEMTLKNDYLAIRVENPYEHELVFIDNKLQTSKKDKLYHGFGLASIQNIAQKYKGNMVWEFKNNQFIINALLQNMSK